MFTSSNSERFMTLIYYDVAMALWFPTAYNYDLKEAAQHGKSEPISVLGFPYNRT
jgi:hypothetical protein